MQIWLNYNFSLFESKPIFHYHNNTYNSEFCADFYYRCFTPALSCRLYQFMIKYKWFITMQQIIGATGNVGTNLRPLLHNSHMHDGTIRGLQNGFSESLFPFTRLRPCQCSINFRTRTIYNNAHIVEVIPRETAH